MHPKMLTIAALAASLTAVTAAAAATKHHVRHRHAAPAILLAEPPAAPRHWEQPHMVQVRPGLWISSWDCITDEGQGRWKPCSTDAMGGRN